MGAGLVGFGRAVKDWQGRVLGLQVVSGGRVREGLVGLWWGFGRAVV